MISRTGSPFHLHVLTLLLIAAAPTLASAAPEQRPLQGYRTEMSFTVHGTPAQVFDAMTGDVTAWWDHGFVKQPKSRVIEPRPGGGFYEWFDDKGNGVQHAVVIYADRGKLLRMRGPFGFSGNATDLVASWGYEAVGDSTRVTVTCNVAGQMEDAWPTAIEGVWSHFMLERFKPWYEQGARRAAPRKR